LSILNEENVSFDTAFAKSVMLEGNYTADPDDKGNWTGGAIGDGELKGTKYGISAAAYPDEDIKNLTLDRAKYLYRRDYWQRLNIGEVPDDQVQEEIFDTAVNMGVGAAGIVVQRGLNFLEIGKPLVVDGAIGPLTLGYLKKWCRKDAEALFKVLNGYQFIRYVEIGESGVMEKYAWGWMKRVQSYRK
jgi:lysozyme family protein